MQPPPPLDSAAALFIDIDGTLLEIAERPELVRVPDDLPGLLAGLAAQRDGALALVSGRPLAQIDRLFKTWRGGAAGLHGLERRRADGTRLAPGDSPADIAAAAALAVLRAELVELGQEITGLLIEDKGGTIAVHYRAAPTRADELRERIGVLIREHGAGLRVIAGKMVFELQPAHHGKDGAIAAFLAEPPFFGRSPVFLGDDTTDEDGFAEINRRGGVSIRVGPAMAETAAHYTLPAVAAVHAWLKAALPS
jgi:trehalose 6-phosphate phosphatase